jgi:hypothetical protein
MLFEDIRSKGLNPYSKKDRDEYVKNNPVPEEKQQALSRISEHAVEFQRRQKQAELRRKKEEIMKQVEEIRLEEARRQREQEEAERRRNSLRRRLIDRIRARAWGEE